MSARKIDRLVKMVNQISLNMRSNGEEDFVAMQVSEHLEKFWSPPMKNLISEQIDKEDLGLTSISYSAIKKLAAIQKMK
jgi:formate dehydrogenase subunit delta